MSATGFTLGQFVIRRRHSRWSWASFEFGRLVKVTEKQAIVHRFRDERVPLGDLIAAYASEDEAQQVLQSLNGIVGEYRRKANAADNDCAARKKVAADDADKTVDRLLAKTVQP